MKTNLASLYVDEIEEWNDDDTLVFKQSVMVFTSLFGEPMYFLFIYSEVVCFSFDNIGGIPFKRFLLENNQKSKQSCQSPVRSCGLYVTQTLVSRGVRCGRSLHR